MLTIPIGMFIHDRYPKTTCPATRYRIKLFKPSWPWYASFDARESAFLTWWALLSRYHTDRDTWHCRDSILPCFLSLSYLVYSLRRLAIWNIFVKAWRRYCCNPTPESVLLDSRVVCFATVLCLIIFYENADYQKEPFSNPTAFIFEEVCSGNPSV